MIESIEPPVEPGPGLFEYDAPEGHRALTNIRKIAGRSRHRRPGEILIAVATALLAVLMAGLLFVSFAAQEHYVFAVKHQSNAAIIEALALDAGMVIFSLLGLGLARAGKSSRVERMLIVACAVASAGMNYLAADASSFRSVAAYTMPPIALAVVTDRVIAVTRRHYLNETESSVWGPVLRGLAVAPLYVLRIPLAPGETGRGFRQAILNATPLPAAPTPIVGALAAPAAAIPLPAPSAAPEAAEAPQTSPAAIAKAQANPELPAPSAGGQTSRRRAPSRRKAASGGVSKTSQLLKLYAAHEHYGDRSKISPVATELAPLVGLDPRSARTAMYRHHDREAGKPGQRDAMTVAWSPGVTPRDLTNLAFGAPGEEFASNDTEVQS
jgi:hypothetical protein